MNSKILSIALALTAGQAFAQGMSSPPPVMFTPAQGAVVESAAVGLATAQLVGQSGFGAADLLSSILQRDEVVRSDYEQHIFEANGELSEIRKGRLWVQRPNRFRIAVLDPFPELILSDGTDLWFYEPQLQQAQVESAEARLQDTPVSLLTASAEDLHKLWKVSLIEQKGDIRVFWLESRDKDGLIRSVEVEVEGNSPTKVNAIDAVGTKLQVILRNTVPQANAPAQLFQFTPPPDVDVLRNDGDS